MELGLMGKTVIVTGGGSASRKEIVAKNPFLRNSFCEEQRRNGFAHFGPAADVGIVRMSVDDLTLYDSGHASLLAQPFIVRKRRR